YFVMELIRGEPITKFCDDQHLTPRERLELFAQVCAGVQHAHQKGVIHRDLKPSNVLVTLYDGRPVPKVIDFGVAKALHQKLTDKTMFTEFGAVIGTLEYMAPEQAHLSHRAALLTAVAFVALLAAAAAVSAWQSVVATRAKGEALAARDAEAEQRRRTRAALDDMLSEESLAFLTTQKDLLPAQRAFLSRV